MAPADKFMKVPGAVSTTTTILGAKFMSRGVDRGRRSEHRSQRRLLFFTALLGLLWFPVEQLSAQVAYYYPMIASPLPLKMVSTRCGRDADEVYNREYQRLAEPHTRLGARGGSMGLLGLSLAGVAMQARGVADGYFKDCMILNGWSPDPADEYQPPPK